MYRRGYIFWGVLLILLATLLLLRQAGLITGDILGYFWPLLIIAVGLWMILGFFGRRQAIQGEQVSIPLEGAKSAFVRFNHGAGRFNLSAGATAGEILNGTFGGGLSYKSQLSGDRLEVKLRTPSQIWAWLPGETLDWDVRLNRDVALNVKVDTGASASVLDLSGLKVVDLDIDSGASSTELTLPAAAGSTHVDIDTGASSLKIHVPTGVAASIRVKSGIASVNVASDRFPRVDGNLYQSADYATAANRADITIDAGVGSIEIK
jgi:hypothetical protein